MRALRRLPYLLPGLALSACGSGPPAPTDQERPEPEAIPPACRALVQAEPGSWPTHWRSCQALGPQAAPGLIAALQRWPEGPGQQAGLHLLGVLGGAQAEAFLRSQLSLAGDRASEAALSLGRMRARGSRPALRQLRDDPTAEPLARVAACAALIRLGWARDCLPMLRAVFLAATPWARPHVQAQGLPPRKRRWAHERYMLIEALRHHYQGETFGLDEDASWPALKAGVTRLEAALSEAK